MTYAGKHPSVCRVNQKYSTGTRRSKKEMVLVEKRLARSADLPKWHVTIAPAPLGEVIIPT